LILHNTTGRTWQPVAFGSKAEHEYNQMGPQEADGYALEMYFKLYLKSTDTKDPAGPPVVDMISHYLKYMYDIIQNHLERAVPRYHPSDVKYCITIPAGWQQHHKHAMRQAAVKAGFITSEASDKLLLLSEPEAAAFTATKTKQMTLRPHENFMIVDAGGGTVDITTYDVVSGKDGGLMLKEIAPPEMLLMGAYQLDASFEQAMRDILADDDVFDRWMETYRGDYMQFISSQWENKIKLNFGQSSGSKLQRYSIPLPITLHQMMSEAGKKRLEQIQQPHGGYIDRIILTFDQARDIFDNVVDPICQKVVELQQNCRHNGRGVSQVLLTGGFGSSPYLQDKLRQMCIGVDIVCPPWGYAATMTGAVYYLQSPDLVAARCVTKTYGLSVYDMSTGRNGVFSTLIKKGTTVTIDEESEPERVHPVDATSTCVSLDIYASDYGNPRYVTDTGCQKVASVIVPVNPQLLGTPGRFGAKARSVEEYIIEIRFKWGGTEVEIIAFDTLAQRPVRATMQYCVDIVEDAPVVFKSAPSKRFG